MLPLVISSVFYCAFGIISVIKMNMTIRLSGIPEKIISGAIFAGLAKTKTDAITLGLLELDNKYKLLEQQEDAEDLRDAERIMAEIKQGKRTLLSAKEFEQETGMKIR